MTPGFKVPNIDLWEAWIDLQPSGDKCVSTLYVTGDITIINNILTEPLFVKRQLTDTPHELALEIVPNVVLDDGYIVEIFYSEELENIDQYDVISIYAGNELIEVITDIEMLY